MITPLPVIVGTQLDEPYWQMMAAEVGTGEATLASNPTPMTVVAKKDRSDMFECS
jgi:hypothetical protein